MKLAVGRFCLERMLHTVTLFYGLLIMHEVSMARYWSINNMVKEHYFLAGLSGLFPSGQDCVLLIF